jgi:uncharacterized protein YndB with AHSA1/START domain
LCSLLFLFSRRPSLTRSASSVQRTAYIKAPPETIFPLINDLNRWTTWSPWEKKDPAMKRTFSAVTSGPGAAYAWDGNKEVGAGRLEITESSPPSKVTMKLDFIKPFEAQDFAEFAVKPEGNGSSVAWTLRGPSPYLAKLMGLFFNIDSMVGKDFEEGLATLKALAEKQASNTQ